MIMILVHDSSVLRKRHMCHSLPNSREIFGKRKFCRLNSFHVTLFFPANDENVLRCSWQLYYHNKELIKSILKRDK